MTPQINKILYLTYLREESRPALVYAAGLADIHGAGLTVLHAFEIKSPNAALIASAFLGYGSINEFARKREAEILLEINDRIAGVCHEISCEFPHCRFRVDQILVETGRPVQIISRHVKQKNFDLLVMGNRRGIRESILGGTVQKALHLCQTPILIIPLKG